MTPNEQLALRVNALEHLVRSLVERDEDGSTPTISEDVLERALSLIGALVNHGEVSALAWITTIVITAVVRHTHVTIYVKDGATTFYTFEIQGAKTMSHNTLDELLLWLDKRLEGVA